MILVKNSKYPSSVLFCKKRLWLLVNDLVFSKGGFLDEQNVILTIVEKFGYF